jgi:hypothetical protein
MLIDSRVDTRSDTISDGSVSPTDRGSISDFHTNTAIMKERVTRVTPGAWIYEEAARRLPTMESIARAKEIVALCDATGADHGKLLAWYKAESFEAMTDAQYSAAKSGLENKLAKVKAAAAPVAGWVEPPKAPTALEGENIENGSSRSSGSKKPD